MWTLELDLPPLHEAQRAIAASSARYRLAACGRRFGKTRLAAALAIEAGLRGGACWWIGPTFPVSAVGWRAISQLAVQIPGAVRREAERRITLPGGGWLQAKSADDPDSLRGEGLDFAVLDEAAFMRPAAWYEALRPALSDRQGRALFCSTPKGGNWFYTLFRRGLPDDPTYDPAYASWNLPTSANPYIAASEIANARRELSLRVFRQEYEADFLGDPEDGLVKRDSIRYGYPHDSGNRVGSHQGQPPDCVRIVVAIDPAVSAGPDSDETGIVVAGLGSDGQGYVLADLSCRLSPEGWARRAVNAYHEFEADAILAEVNNGGDLVQAVLRTVDPRVPYKPIHAARGKLVRAEPVSALYEQGRVFHVEPFAELEDQLCRFVPGQFDGSPDRLDALVYALTELLVVPGKRRLHAY